MPSIALTPALRKAYSDLFETCEPNPTQGPELERITAAIVLQRPRYDAVATRTSVPWYLIGVLHSMEASLRFDRHLHNGDPLTGRTVHVPANRPAQGTPPFTWETSAEDAIRFSGLNKWTDWSVPGLLYRIECYNGLGYRLYHPEVLTPYLWSGSCHYKQGKFTGDGKWSATAKSKQCGAAVLLRMMTLSDTIDLRIYPEAA